MSTIEEIERLEAELSEAEKEYLRSVGKCGTTECSFYNASQSGNCSWSVKLELCREYEEEE
jgi:hypothetical protein